MEIKLPDPGWLSKLDIPMNVWSFYNQGMQVYRTTRGTGLVHMSDCVGNYDNDGIYQSTFWQVETPDGLLMGIGAMDWEKAKQKVEENLNEKA